ncbi:MAG: tetratricopeptide repeat protein [Pyrinomonadaceae bacterium]
MIYTANFNLLIIYMRTKDERTWAQQQRFEEIQKLREKTLRNFCASLRCARFQPLEGNRPNMPHGFTTQLILCSACVLLVIVFGMDGDAQASALSESTRALYKGEYQQAAQLAEKHLQKHPRNAPARVMLARAQLAQGKFQQAFQELRKALASDPRSIDAHYYLAIVAKALSQQEYRRLFALAPDSDRVHQLLAEAALARTDYAEAEAEFLAALKVKPRSVEVLTELGELNRLQSNFDEATAYYKQAEQIGPLDYDIAYGLGACYTYKQNYKQAIEYLRKAVEAAPDLAAGRFALGNALFQSGESEAAIPELKASPCLEPKLKQAYFLMGRAYQKLGQQSEAKAAFTKLEEINRSETPGQETDSSIERKQSEPPNGAAPAPRNACHNGSSGTR